MVALQKLTTPCTAQETAHDLVEKLVSPMVAAMAVFAHDALGEGSVGFALAYAAFQIILTFLWWRTGVHDPNHRPLSRPYSAAFLVTTLLFAGSVFVASPARFYLWGVAVLLSLMLPFNAFRQGRHNRCGRSCV